MLTWSSGLCKFERIASANGAAAPETFESHSSRRVAATTEATDRSDEFAVIAIDLVLGVPITAYVVKAVFFGGI